MAQTSPAGSTTTDASPTEAEMDWPARLTAQFVDLVGTIREQTSGRAVVAVRYIQYAAFAISLGTVALLIFVIGGVRALDNYLPDAVFGETHTWAAHGILGLVLLVSGIVLLRAKARPPADD